MPRIAACCWARCSLAHFLGAATHLSLSETRGASCRSCYTTLSETTNKVPDFDNICTDPTPVTYKLTPGCTGRQNSAWHIVCSITGRLRLNCSSNSHVSSPTTSTHRSENKSKKPRIRMGTQTAWMQRVTVCSTSEDSKKILRGRRSIQKGHKRRS